MHPSAESGTFADKRDVHRPVRNRHKGWQQFSRAAADDGEVALMLTHDHHEHLPAITFMSAAFLIHKSHHDSFWRLLMRLDSPVTSQHQHSQSKRLGKTASRQPLRVILRILQCFGLAVSVATASSKALIHALSGRTKWHVHSWRSAVRGSVACA